MSTERPDTSSVSTEGHPRARFKPEAIRPLGANLEHTAVLLLLLLGSLGVLLMGALSLPLGAVAWLSLVPACVWAWLAWQAMRANSAVEDLRARGHIVTGTVTACLNDDVHHLVRYSYEVSPLDEVGESVRWDCESNGLTRWMTLRYEEDMRVAVLIDPNDPSLSSLYPPPGGGGTLDLMGDCFVWALRRVTTRPTPRDLVDPTVDEELP